MKVRLKKSYHRIMPGRKQFLTPGKVYDVISVEYDCYRIVNDRHDPRLGLDPVLYPSKLFDVVDATEPIEWVSQVDDGGRCAGPPELDAIGFWEDYHDGVPEAIQVFKDYLAKSHKGDRGGRRQTERD